MGPQSNIAVATRDSGDGGVNHFSSLSGDISYVTELNRGFSEDQEAELCLEGSLSSKNLEMSDRQDILKSLKLTSKAQVFQL